jgi:hypothetical protein
LLSAGQSTPCASFRQIVAPTAWLASSPRDRALKASSLRPSAGSPSLIHLILFVCLSRTNNATPSRSRATSTAALLFRCSPPLRACPRNGERERESFLSGPCDRRISSLTRRACAFADRPMGVAFGCCTRHDEQQGTHSSRAAFRIYLVRMFDDRTAVSARRGLHFERVFSSLQGWT